MRCEKKREQEALLTEIRASIWQVNNDQKDKLIKELNKNKELSVTKQRQLARSESRLRRRKLKKEQKAISQPKKQETLFKEPALPDWSTKRLKKATNELFNQMLIIPACTDRDLVDVAPKSLESVSKYRENAPPLKKRKTFDDEQMSFLSMSSIEGLDSLENRLMGDMSQTGYEESSLTSEVSAL